MSKIELKNVANFQMKKQQRPECDRQEPNGLHKAKKQRPTTSHDALPRASAADRHRHVVPVPTRTNHFSHRIGANLKSFGWMSFYRDGKIRISNGNEETSDFLGAYMHEERQFPQLPDMSPRQSIRTQHYLLRHHWRVHISNKTGMCYLFNFKTSKSTYDIKGVIRYLCVGCTNDEDRDFFMMYGWRQPATLTQLMSDDRKRWLRGDRSILQADHSPQHSPGKRVALYMRKKKREKRRSTLSVRLDTSAFDAGC